MIHRGPLRKMPYGLQSEVLGDVAPSPSLVTDWEQSRRDHLTFLSPVLFFFFLLCGGGRRGAEGEGRETLR